MEAQVFYAWILDTMEETGFFFFFVLDPKLKTSSWGLAVIQNMTEVFVECKVLYLLYHYVHKYANEHFTMLVLTLYWHWIKSKVGGGLLPCSSLAVIAVFLK